MAQELKIRRGSSSENDAFTGALAELSYDTQTKELRTHDGATQGGRALALKPYDTVQLMLASTASTLGPAGQIVEGGGFRYQVAATGATDHHVTTAGGVKLYVLSSELRAFGAVGDGVADDTAVIQKWLDSVGDTTYGSGGFGVGSPPRGKTLTASEGDYRFTAKLTVKNNTKVQGTGWGTKFRFDPSAALTDAFAVREFAAGSALNALNVRFADFMLYVAPDGGTTTGRNGQPLNTVNANSRHGVNAENAGPGIVCERVFFSDFHYGRGYHSEANEPAFAFYNNLISCVFRDCWQGYKLTSASGAYGCYVGHGDRYPAADRMSEHEYVLDTTGTRGTKVTGSIECYASIALIKDNGAGHDFAGLYIENFPPTPAYIDAGTLSHDSTHLVHGPYSAGYTKNRIVNNNVARTGNFNFNFGLNLNTGDYEEVEIYQTNNNQSPSFRYGLPGRGHYPTGGTLEISDDSFIDPTALVLSRGASNDTISNTASYSFRIRGGRKLLSNVWVTLLIKVEGGEDDWFAQLSDSPSNANFVELFTYPNGWKLYGTYMNPGENQIFNLLVRQNVGSTDSARKVRFTALRAYVNGFAPIPAPYKWPEYRTAAPAQGFWLRGQEVKASQPTAGGAPGWTSVFDLSTTLAAAEPSGETEMAVASGADTLNGDIIGVKLDSGQWHWAAVASGGGTTALTLTAALPGDAASGNAVWVYRFKAHAALAA